MKGFAPARDVRRIFIAVDIGDDVRACLEQAQRRLRRQWPDIKWVAVGNIHLTLVFLGDVVTERIPAVAAMLDRVAGETAPFTCDAAGLGWFGSRVAPRVIWAGVARGREQLAALRGGIAAGVQALDLRTEERAFTPHLTLARVKRAGDAAGVAEQLAAASTQAFGVVTVESVRLLSSELRPTGPVYTVLHEARLIGRCRGHEGGGSLSPCAAGAQISGSCRVNRQGAPPRSRVTGHLEATDCACPHDPRPHPGTLGSAFR